MGAFGDWDVAVFRAFAAADEDGGSFEVDVAECEVDQFLAAQGAGIPPPAQQRRARLHPLSEDVVVGSPISTAAPNPAFSPSRAIPMIARLVRLQ